MSTIPFKNIIMPKLKSFTPETEFGRFHEILAKSLEEWFNSILFEQSGVAVGTVTNADGVYPFIYPLMKLNITQMFFEAVSIRQCASGDGSNFYPNLFNYIGRMISKQLLPWSSASGVMMLNPIRIYGTLSPATSFATGHFYSIGLEFKQTIALKNIADECIFDLIWEEFGNKLVYAINTIPVQILPTMGITPKGVFTGVTSIKLRA